MKYPRTPYWPTSPSIAPGDRVIGDVEIFTKVSVVITEKLDGSNTTLYKGEATTRSGDSPAWLGMAKKHHAWKMFDSDVYLYGEDIYGIHSIEYDPVEEDHTFYAFAAREGTRFMSWYETVNFATRMDIPTVPELYRGRLHSVEEIDRLLEKLHGQESMIGGEREGLVLRIAYPFDASQFSKMVCKSVRPNHVQTDEHWTKNWKNCIIKERQL